MGVRIINVRQLFSGGIWNEEHCPLYSDQHGSKAEWVDPFFHVMSGSIETSRNMNCSRIFCTVVLLEENHKTETIRAWYLSVVI